MDMESAQEQIQSALLKKEMLMMVGTCFVEYLGRATSKLPRGKRMLLLKGDGSISVHQNRLVRPINYMVNTRVSTSLEDGTLLLTAKDRKRAESLHVTFYDLDDVRAYPIAADEPDLRLSGSERHLTDLLMQDLSVIEPGLEACKTEQIFRKGVVDIIAKDSKDRLVVIEVKRRQADFNSVTQLQRYMQQVEKTKGVKTRGILVAPSIGKPARELLEENGLEFAKLDFELLPAEKEKARIKGLEKKQKTLFEISQSSEKKV